MACLPIVLFGEAPALAACRVGDTIWEAVAASRASMGRHKLSRKHASISLLGLDFGGVGRVSVAGMAGSATQKGQQQHLRSEGLPSAYSRHALSSNV